MRIPRPGRKNRRYALMAVLCVVLTMVFTLLPCVAAAQTSVLVGNHPQTIDALTSPAPPNLLLDLRISFLLRNRPELEKLLRDLQDRSSPQYHRWLTPAEFDARFGRTPDEVKAVSKWLSGRGFHINSANVREIQASASVTAAENTFSTAITGSPDASLYANQSDPRIPARFAGVIGSIGGLDNLHHWFPRESVRRQRENESHMQRRIWLLRLSMPAASPNSSTKLKRPSAHKTSIAFTMKTPCSTPESMEVAPPLPTRQSNAGLRWWKTRITSTPR